MASSWFAVEDKGVHKGQATLGESYCFYTMGTRECPTMRHHLRETTIRKREAALQLKCHGDNKLSDDSSGQFKAATFIPDNSTEFQLSLESSMSNIPEITRARAKLEKGFVIDEWVEVVRDFTPNAYQSDMLELQCGDRVGIIEKYESGVWCGMKSHRIGMFKFVHTNGATERSATERSTECQATEREREFTKKIRY